MQKDGKTLLTAFFSLGFSNEKKVGARQIAGIDPVDLLPTMKKTYRLIGRETTVMTARVLLPSAMLLIGAIPARTQQNAIHIGTTVNVSADIPKVPLGETWLASNPRDPKNMIASSMAFPKEGDWASVMYYTTDAGKNWQRVIHGRNHEAYFWGADPTIVFGPNGTAYYSDLEWGSVGSADFLEEPRSPGASLQVYMFRSTDGGRTWSDPIGLDGEDHSSIAVDNSHGKYDGRVYVAYKSEMSSAQGKDTAAIGLAYSDDDGLTYKQRVFSPPEVSFRNRIRVGPSPMDLLVAPDGTLVLPYIYYLAPESQTAEPSERIEQIWVITSADGGRSFSEPHFVAESTFPTGHNSKIKGPFTDYWPRMVIDNSETSNRGHLYMTNQNVSNNRVRILVRRSSDMGQTWGEAVQVNDDRTQADQDTAGIAVSQNGTVGVSWYDRRNDPKDNCFQELFSASLDGGVTFLPNVVVHEPPTCTLTQGNWQPNVSQSLDVSRGIYKVELASPGARFINGGDTQGIVGLAGGNFHLAWINGENGVMQLSSTAVEVTAHPLGQDVGDLLEVRTNLPTIDIHTHTMTLQVTVMNRSRKAMVSPITLVLSQVESLFEGLRAVNSDNRLAGVGALWYLVTGSKRANLQPGEATEPITLKFEFDKVPENTLDAAPLDAAFHIFESRP